MLRVNEPTPSTNRNSETACRRLATGLLFGALALLAAPVHAQQSPEPVLDQVRELFSTEGLNFGFLLQGVVDPGIDSDPARVTVPNARLRLSGRLDGGFSYQLQTNHAGASTLLDARVTWSPGPELAISAGRFKTPFSREFLTYGGGLDFVTRARVVNGLAPNRQLGVQVASRMSERVSITAGGFTGPTSGTTDESLLGVLRLEGGGIEIGEGRLAVAGQIAGGRENAVGGRQLGTPFRGDGILWGLDGRYETDVLMLSGEYIRGDWEPDFGVTDVVAQGLFLTAGFTVQENRQVLLRWDRYEAPGQEADDILVFGFNTFPTSAAKIQVNWLVPVGDSNQVNKLLVNFQIGI